MKERTKNQKEWLQEQNRDQNLQGLENLVNTEKNDRGRKWYPSQVIHPTAPIARYNPSRGKYETLLGSSQSVNDNTSAAVYTMTCPENRRRYVDFVSAVDGVTSTNWYIEHLAADGATVRRALYDEDNVAIGTTQVLVGGDLYVDEIGTQHACLRPFWMEPGDTLTTTAADFVALDTILIVMTYRDVVIG